jgi:hypothetical protein
VQLKLNIAVVYSLPLLAFQTDEMGALIMSENDKQQIKKILIWLRKTLRKQAGFEGRKL